MNRGTSLYLDVARIVAALVVFAEHAREHTRNSFHWFWVKHPAWFYWSDPLSLVGGMVVFVLSGYVIAYVMATRENTLAIYSASRIARLYSITIPAVLLAIVTNYAEAQRYPDAFSSYADIPTAVRYLGSMFFATNYWIWPDLGPPNLPFWRLSYEVVFYVAIALIVLARGWTRILGIASLCLITGPTAVLLAPTWFIGYAMYHFARGREVLKRRYALAVWAGSMVGLLVLGPVIEVHFRQHLHFLRMPDNTTGGLLAAYVEAACFAVNILAVDALSGHVELFLRPFAKVISWLAGTTFALYMFHQPLLSFFTVYPVGLSYEARSSLEQAALLIGGTLLIVGTAGHFFERLKRPYKKFLLQTLSYLAVLARQMSGKIAARGVSR